MKKIGFFLLTICILSLCVACGDDEITGSPSDFSPSLPKTYKVDYRVKADAISKTSEVASLRVRYYDANGNIVTEEVTEQEWNKHVDFNVGADTRIGLRAEWVLKSKEEIAAVEEKEYDMTINIASLYDCVRNDGTVITSSFLSKQNVGTTGKMSKEKLLELTGNPYCSFLFVFKKLDNGQFFSAEESFPNE